MKKEERLSVQKWLPFEIILEKGIIRLKNNSYIKIIKIIPINFNLKSDLEKEAILNSYKVFLKTCNFDIQILIQSNKEDLSNHISNVNNQIKKENNLNLLNISKKYINYIQNLNQNKKSSSKNFYILIKEIPNKNSNINNENLEEIITSELNDKYFKIKECLSRCGNISQELSKEDTKNMLFSFLNSRLYFNN